MISFSLCLSEAPSLVATSTYPSLIPSHPCRSLAAKLIFLVFRSAGQPTLRRRALCSRWLHALLIWFYLTRLVHAASDFVRLPQPSARSPTPLGSHSRPFAPTYDRLLALDHDGDDDGDDSGGGARALKTADAQESRLRTASASHLRRRDADRAESVRHALTVGSERDAEREDPADRTSFGRVCSTAARRPRRVDLDDGARPSAPTTARRDGGLPGLIHYTFENIPTYAPSRAGDVITCLFTLGRLKGRFERRKAWWKGGWGRPTVLNACFANRRRPHSRAKGRWRGYPCALDRPWPVVLPVKRRRGPAESTRVGVWGPVGSTMRGCRTTGAEGKGVCLMLMAVRVQLGEGILFVRAAISKGVA
ncbi:uncharacterized protein SCHCODRAFT_0231843 [Schizophyllum commune H4-8]|uniref:uncharacterized protein n=1 Tax=Schizophyllum commune (strain H4-8 / FGSC 9210) TaxID=578458 RepID=UPI00215EE92E|nr:uncharacterized protein SCHCODRAFT_0231843 [Schizophyllum commune H4-8]KAI5897549.1 hypothetical protein SCHCODRAFT_0231843 [Schizophyllum commune H4-8]